MDGWLVFTRKTNQDIIIGDNIVVRVAEVRGSQVRLAMHAPSDVAVDRREIRDAKRRDGEYIGGDW
jgi:carbon storage regulator